MHRPPGTESPEPEGQQDTLPPMIHLPIVDRELRVACRRPSFFRARMWAVMGTLLMTGILLGVYALTTRGGGGFGVPVGRMLFETFKWLSFLGASFAGVILTADCLSDEKREGTLGLLFLTDLRGYDVVLGKVATHALQSVYAFLAAFPVVGTCFLFGGVTGSEFFQIMVVLLVTLFLSLSVGALVSACNRETARTMTLTLAIMLGLMLGLPYLDSWLGKLLGGSGSGWLIRLSPAYALLEAGSSTGPRFEQNVLCLAGLALAFLTGSCLILPRTWQAGSEPRRKGPKGSVLATSDPSARPPLPTPSRAILNREPTQWLAGRLHRPGPVVWGATLLTLAGMIIALTLRRSNPAGGVDATAQLVAWLLTVFVRFWLVLHACRFWTDARSSGAFELLLVTPIRPRDLIRGQWRALCRTFLPVVLVVTLIIAGVGYLQMLDLMAVNRAALGGAATGAANAMSVEEVDRMLNEIRLQHLTSLGFNIVQQFTSFWALGWMAIWMGMVTQRVQVAVAKALVFADFLPMLGGILLELLLSILAQGRFGLGIVSTPIISGFVALMIDGILAWVAYKRAHARVLALAAGNATP